MKSDLITIGVLGSNGTIGRELINILEMKGFNLKKGYNKNHLRGRDFKPCCFDINDSDKLREFCRGVDILVGTAGPSFKFSEKMNSMALAMKIPYIDPNGSQLLKKENEGFLSIVDVGLMPGFVGILFRYCLNKTKEIPIKVEIFQGGSYAFSKSSLMDYLYTIKYGSGKNSMKCIKDGVEKQNYNFFAKIPDCIKKLTNYKLFPYLTDEIKRIGHEFGIKNIDAYTTILEGLDFKNIEATEDNIDKFYWSQKNERDNIFFVFKLIYKNKNKTIVVQSQKPNYVTAYILYSVVNWIQYNEIAKKGIYRYSDFIDDEYYVVNLIESMPIQISEYNK